MNLLKIIAVKVEQCTASRIPINDISCIYMNEPDHFFIKSLNLYSDFVDLMFTQCFQTMSLNIWEHLKNNLGKNRITNDFDYLIEEVLITQRPVNRFSRQTDWLIFCEVGPFVMKQLWSFTHGVDPCRQWTVDLDTSSDVCKSEPVISGRG